MFWRVELIILDSSLNAGMIIEKFIEFDFSMSLKLFYGIYDSINLFIGDFRKHR
tara:strand:+ start:119 stop:280 length:162 start_codon:yes stop_codon:yes gene_type:complete